VSSELVDIELELLQAIAGERPPLAWGGAVGQALEMLRGRGLVELGDRAWRVSAKGYALLERKAKQREGDGA
jgi:membrane protein implicated in regulation of membrane protease activity